MATFNETEKGTHYCMSIYKDGWNVMHQLVVNARQDGIGAVITSVIAKDGTGHGEKNKAVRQFFSKLRSLKDGELLHLEGVEQGGLTGHSGLPAVPTSTGNVSLGQPGNQTITHPTAAGNPVKIVTPDGNTEIDAHYAVVPANSLTASNTADSSAKPHRPAITRYKKTPRRMRGVANWESC